jgi:tetraprenyl-beta-curcumene synthase
MAFIVAARRYWGGVFPSARCEMSRMRSRASGIPDPLLRNLALLTRDAKWDNLEGAAAFAAFVPREHLCTVAGLLVGLQGIYDYADTLIEEAGESRPESARRLHTAVLAALDPHTCHLDYYEHHECSDDGGYLTSLVEGCRAAVTRLPSYPRLAGAVLEQGRRIVDYQSYINLDADRGYPEFVRWAGAETPPGTHLRWWETGAACGSSMALFALVARAASRRVSEQEAEAIESVYWPWAGALHTLLDGLLDRAEDAETGQHNLLGHYGSLEEMADRMELLTVESVRRAATAGTAHTLIVTAAPSLYLADARAWLPEVRPATERVLGALGGIAAPAMLILRARRFLAGQARTG